MPAPQKKILIIVMDGLGDRVCPGLRGMTPLQYMRTPNLDWFVAHGQGGLCDPISPGIRPGSDTAHLSILGYDVNEVYTGRGPFEALGVGMDIQPGDVALRCNFATVDDSLEIVDRRAGRIREPETTELVEALDGIEFEGIECYVKESTEHRAVLLLRGDDLDPRITDPDPGGDTHLRMAEPLVEEAQLTADVVNLFMEECHQRLRNHPTNRKRVAAGLPPANILVPRGAGSFPHIDPFPEVHGISATCVAGVGMIKGICKACGLDVYPLPDDCDGSLESDYIIKAQCAMEALDLIRSQCRTVIEDKYIRMANSYDNKMLLVSEIHAFLQTLEGEGVIQAGSSYVELNLDKQKQFLKNNGVDVSGMTDQEILKADTGSWVFIKMGGVVLDAMEDFDLDYYMGGDAA